MMAEMCVDEWAAFDALHHIIDGELQRFQIGLGDRKAPGRQLS